MNPDQPTYDLKYFSLSDMTALSVELRKIGHECESMEACARAAVHTLYDRLRDRTSGVRQCTLVRAFKTHSWSRLGESEREFAAAALADGDCSPAMKCLTLLATAGDEPEWNRREASAGHLAIPLPSAEAVSRMPMIARLVSQLGLDPENVVEERGPLLLDEEQQSFNVFYVPEARASRFIPAQKEFVERYGVRSVLGFGGILPFGDLFAVILFAKCAIPAETSELFKPLALSTKVALLPFADAHTI